MMTKNISSAVLVILLLLAALTPVVAADS